MGSYRVLLKPSVEKDFRKLDQTIVRRILAALEGLAVNPLPSSAKKLVGSKSTFRIRIGDYRVIYTFMASEVEIQSVKHRKDVYR